MKKIELNENQLTIIKDNNQKVIVNSAPASGKTTCLIEKINYLLKENPDLKIVAITFTNAAANNIKSRLEFYNPSKIFIGTIHSYCNRILLGQNISTKEILKKGEFNKLFYLVAQKELTPPEIDFLLLDEAQDSDENQFKFIFNFLKPKKWILFSDHRQSIYRWNGAKPELIIKLMKEKDVTVYNLNKNYRNGSHILSLAKEIIRKNGEDYFDFSICCNDNFGEEISDLRNPWQIVEYIANNFKNDLHSTAILCRFNSDIELFEEILYHYNLPYIKLDDLDSLKSDNEIVPKIKLTTIHKAKGLEWNNVAVYGVNTSKLEEICIAYVGFTRARKNLIWSIKKHFY